MTLQHKLGPVGPLGELQGLVHACGRQLSVDVAVLALEQAAVGGPQVPVEEGIYKRVNERVCVAQPQECPLHPERDAAAGRAADEGPRRGEQEERQPAHGEGPHDDAQGGGCLLLPLEDGDVLPLVPEESREVGTLLHLLLQLHHAVQGDEAVGLRQAREAGELVLGRAPPGGLVDLVVHEQHDRHGDVEGHRRGVDGVAKILADQAHLVVVDILGPAEERGQGDGGGQEPDGENHLGHAFPVLPHRVGQRPRDPEVPGRETQREM